MTVSDFYERLFSMFSKQKDRDPAPEPPPTKRQKRDMEIRSGARRFVGRRDSAPLAPGDDAVRFLVDEVSTPSGFSYFEIIDVRSFDAVEFFPVDDRRPGDSDQAADVLDVADGLAATIDLRRVVESLTATPSLLGRGCQGRARLKAVGDFVASMGPHVHGLRRDADAEDARSGAARARVEKALASAHDDAKAEADRKAKLEEQYEAFQKEMTKRLWEAGEENRRFFERQKAEREAREAEELRLAFAEADEAARRRDEEAAKAAETAFG